MNSMFLDITDAVNVREKKESLQTRFFFFFFKSQLIEIMMSDT